MEHFVSVIQLSQVLVYIIVGEHSRLSFEDLHCYYEFSGCIVNGG